MEDKFKINWSEIYGGVKTVSVTGYSYQIDGWHGDLLKKYPKSKYNTRIVTTISHSDGLVTKTVSRDTMEKE